MKPQTALALKYIYHNPEQLEELAREYERLNRVDLTQCEEKHQKRFYEFLVDAIERMKL